MAKHGNPTVVPLLRFPEFRDAHAWEECPLGELAEFFKGKGLSKSELVADGQAMCIHYGELFTTYTEVIAEVIGRTQPKTDAFLSLQDDVLMPTSDVTPIGLAKASCIKIEGVILGGDILVIRPDRKKISGEFLARQIRHLERAVLKLVSGTTVFHLYASSAKNLGVAYPSIVEQQKIADCLRSLDEMIAAQARKVAGLKTYKRGLAQQLFPREGESVPRLRFARFRNSPEWSNTPLDPFIEEFREKSQSQDQHEVLTSARSGLVRQRDYYDNDRLVERENIGFNVIPPNYITYRSRSDDRRFYFNENNLGITGIISIYYPVFRIRGGSNKFFVELLSQNSESVGKRSVGTSQTVLSLNELRRLKLPVPTREEQEQIAGALASLDDGIAIESAKLEALKSHKKGLMQQLFPKPMET